MLVSLNLEVMIFLKTVVGGFVMGMIFDIYRVLRCQNKKIFLITAGDIGIWIIMAFAAFETVSVSNSGAVRFFVAAGMLIGFVLYNVFFSRYFCRFIAFVLSILKKLLSLVLIPIFKIKRGVNFVFDACGKIFVIVVNWLKLQKKRLNFIKNRQIFNFKRLNRIFRKN